MTDDENKIEQPTVEDAGEDQPETQPAAPTEPPAQGGVEATY